MQPIETQPRDATTSPYLCLFLLCLSKLGLLRDLGPACNLHLLELSAAETDLLELQLPATLRL